MKARTVISAIAIGVLYSGSAMAEDRNACIVSCYRAYDYCRHPAAGEQPAGDCLPSLYACTCRCGIRGDCRRTGR